MRFLALIRAPGAEAGRVARVASRLRALPDGMHLRDDGRVLCAIAGCPSIETEGGLIVGALFDRRFPAPVRTLDGAAWQQILASRGRHLVETYWGGYVAILTDSDGAVHAVRAPFGELPCYRLEGEGICALASDPTMLIEAGLLKPALAWDAIVHDLALPDLRASRTCLEGVEALRGGERLTVSGGRPLLETLWSPWSFAQAAKEEDRAQLDEEIRRVAQGCVASRACAFNHVLLLLSGGLDSSIVAACLARGRTPFTLLTMVTRDPLGDERAYGRAMAASIGKPLQEALRDIDRIDPERSRAERLAYPAARLFEQETERISNEAGALAGARAILTGGGGDNVFCALQSAAPAADRLLACGPGRGFLATAGEISRLAPASLWTVVRAAIGRAWRRASHAVAPDLSFLSSEAALAVGRGPRHPWLPEPRDVLPGKAAHARLLAFAESFQQGFDPQAEITMIAPLLGQPLVEACLAVPSWSWLEEGRNRAVARRAFARELPDSIVSRRSKGTPDSFSAEIYERHRLRLRERVLGGSLAEHAIIDVDAVRRAFDEAGSIAPAEYRRMLRLADVENWARAWGNMPVP